MMEYMAQLGLLAQRPGGDEWINILVVVVMAILWLLGGFLKATGKKKPQQGQQDVAKSGRRPGETWQDRLRRRAQEMQRRFEEEAGLREQGEQPRRPRESAPRPAQAPTGKVTVRPGRKGDSILVYEQPPRQSGLEQEQLAARQREAQKAAAERSATRQTFSTEPMIEAGEPGFQLGAAPEPLEPGEIRLKPPGEPAGFEPGAIIDYSDPDALKKAILHYEILGKPLALRDSEQTQTF